MSEKQIESSDIPRSNVIISDPDLMEPQRPVYPESYRVVAQNELRTSLRSAPETGADGERMIFLTNEIGEKALSASMMGLITAHPRFKADQEDAYKERQSKREKLWVAEESERTGADVKEPERFALDQEVAVGRNRKTPEGGKYTEIEHGWIVRFRNLQTGEITVFSPDGKYSKTYSPKDLAAVQERSRREAGEKPAASGHESSKDYRGLIDSLSRILAGLHPDKHHIDPAFRASDASGELKNLADSILDDPGVSSELLQISHDLWEAYATRRDAYHGMVSQKDLDSAADRIRKVMNLLKK